MADCKQWAIGTITIYRRFKYIVLVFFSCSYCTPSRSIIIFSQPRAYPPKGVNANPVLTYGRNRKMHDFTMSRNGTIIVCLIPMCVILAHITRNIFLICGSSKYIPSSIKKSASSGY